MIGQGFDPMDKIRAGPEIEGEEHTSFDILSNRHIRIQLKTQSDPPLNVLVSRNPSDRPLHPFDLLRKMYIFCGVHMQGPDGYPSLVPHAEITQSQPRRHAKARKWRLTSVTARNDLENQIPLPILKPEDRERSVMEQSVSA